MSTTVTTPLSGEVACPFCDLPGKCDGGLILDSVASATQADCEAACGSYSLCQYYTFDQENQRCSVYKASLGRKSRAFYCEIKISTGWGGNLFRRVLKNVLGYTAAAMPPKQARGTFSKHIAKPSEQVAAPDCILLFPLRSLIKVIKLLFWFWWSQVISLTLFFLFQFELDFLI